MRQFMMTVTALVVFGAMVVTTQAENQNPNPRTVSGSAKKRTVSQTARPSRTASAAATCTGLKLACLSGSDCIYNSGFPNLTRPTAPPVVCGGVTRYDGQIISPKIFCNSTWQECMKTGWWEGQLLHRPVERR
jgi:hypothetical protein